MTAEMAWERVALPAAGHELPVAAGGSVAPHRLLEAHRHGAFPYPRCAAHAATARGPRCARRLADGRIPLFPPDPGAPAAEPLALTWWSPARRPVLPVGTPLCHSLRESDPGGPRWIVTCDHDFAAVLDSCRTRGDARWITEPLRASFIALHRAGWSHSIEIWQGEDLIAGLLGTGIGGVFSVDCAFGPHPHAVRAAFADLSRRLCGHAELIDLQVPRPYAGALHARPVDRRTYLDALLTIDLPLALPSDVLAVQPLPHPSSA